MAKCSSMKKKLHVFWHPHPPSHLDHWNQTRHVCVCVAKQQKGRMVVLRMQWCWPAPCVHYEPGTALRWAHNICRFETCRFGTCRFQNSVVLGPSKHEQTCALVTLEGVPLLPLHSFLGPQNALFRQKPSDFWVWCV